MKVEDLYKPGIEGFCESYQSITDSQHVVSLLEKIKTFGDSGSLGKLELSQFDYASLRGAIVLVLMAREDFGNEETANYLAAVRESFHVDCEDDEEVNGLLQGLLGGAYA